MRLRSFLAFASLLIASAAVRAEPPKPAVVVQAKPVSRLLGDFRDLVRQVAGPAEAEKAIKGINNGIKEALGEQGFEGLDTNRPFGGYVILGDELPNTQG